MCGGRAVRRVMVVRRGSNGDNIKDGVLMVFS